MLGKTAKGKQTEDKETEYASYEICRKSKVGEYIQAGQEFFVADMKKKKIYSSNDLRLRELSEKVDSEDTFVFKEATYMQTGGQEVDTGTDEKPQHHRRNVWKRCTGEYGY